MTKVTSSENIALYNSKPRWKSVCFTDNQRISHKGQIYQVVDKKQKKYRLIEILARQIIGAAATLVSIGLAPIFCKKIRELFYLKKTVIFISANLPCSNAKDNDEVESYWEASKQLPYDSKPEDGISLKLKKETINLYRYVLKAKPSEPDRKKLFSTCAQIAATRHAKNKTQICQTIPGYTTALVSKQNNKKKKSLLLITDNFLGSGSFNMATRVYDVAKGKERALREAVRFDATIAHWNTETSLHQMLQKEIPGVVKVYNVIKKGNDKTPQYRATLLQLCQGDLFEWTYQKLSDSQRRSALSQILATLSALHRLGYVHNDLKPGNILYKISPDKKTITTKITDFGKTQKIEERNCSMGTYKYVPLDGVYKGYASEKEIALKAEAWAVGLIAYELKYGIFQQFDGLSESLGHHDTKSTFSNSYKNLKDSSKLEADIHKFITTVGNHYRLDEKTLDKSRSTKFDDLYFLLFNSTLDNKYRKEFFDLFDPVVEKLSKGDSEDKLIADLLNPDPKKRIKVEEALTRYSSYLSPDSL